MLKHHPDKNSNVTDTDADRERKDGFFTCIKKAYEVLNDVKMRRLYDSVDMEDDDIGEHVCVSCCCDPTAPPTNTLPFVGAEAWARSAAVVF